jgi:carbonic anhydrase
MHQSFVEMLQGNESHVAEFRDRFDDVQDAQYPDAVTICCSDSRVLQDHAWGNEKPGHIFTCGNIGNRVVQHTESGPAVSGDVLYPIAHAGTEVAVVMGHTGCGAVTATYDDITGGLSEPAGIEHCVGLLRPHIEPGVDALPEDVDRTGAINRLVEYNVDRQVAFLRESEDISDSVDIVGAVYDFQDVYSGERGEVHVINVDGETDPDALRSAHPESESRVERLRTY